MNDTQPEQRSVDDLLAWLRAQGFRISVHIGEDAGASVVLSDRDGHGLRRQRANVARATLLDALEAAARGCQEAAS